jgi:hypothetical protein
MSNLEQASHKMAEVLYRAQPGTPGPGGPSGRGPTEEPGPGPQEQPKQGDVIDAEYVDVDESKKPN